MPVRSELQRKKAREAARETAWISQLAAHRPAASETPDPVHLAQEMARTHATYVCRDPARFNRSIRSKDPGKVRLAVADYVFGRYPAAPHIRSVWYADEPPSGDRGAAVRRSLDFRRRVYFEAVSGGSVHRSCTQAFMTRKETHRFLSLTHTDSFVAALWFALARSSTDDPGVAKRMSVSRLAAEDFADPFWREVLRFFCLHPTPIARMNDMIDFLRQEHQRNPAYSIRGRTVLSLSEQVEQWHRALARARRMGDAKWPGVDMDDAQYLNQPSPKGRRQDWSFSQIKTSQDLAEEGTKMHHCVYSYQRACINGDTSIWSLKVRAAGAGAAWSRALTIEMRNAERRLVQIRGFANRLMNLEERQIVSKWAAENGLSRSYA